MRAARRCGPRMTASRATCCRLGAAARSTRPTACCCCSTTAADAVGYALAYHRALEPARCRRCRRAPACTSARSCCARTRAADVARGAKPLEVEGVAKPTAARVMSVGAGRADPADGRRAAGARHRRLSAAVARPLAPEGPGRADRAVRGRRRRSAASSPPPDARQGLPRRAPGRPLAAGARDPAQPAGRARRLRRPREALARAGAPLRRRRAAGVGARHRRHRQDAPRRRASAGAGSATFPGGVWFCDLSQARSVDGIVQRGGAGARRAARQGRSGGAARPRDRRARPLPGDPRQLRAGRAPRRADARPLARPRRARPASSSRRARCWAWPARRSLALRAAGAGATRRRCSCSARRRRSADFEPHADDEAADRAAGAHCSTACRWRSSWPRRACA